MGYQALCSTLGKERLTKNTVLSPRGAVIIYKMRMKKGDHFNSVTRRDMSKEVTLMLTSSRQANIGGLCDVSLCYSQKRYWLNGRI